MLKGLGVFFFFFGELLLLSVFTIYTMKPKQLNTKLK